MAEAEHSQVRFKICSSAQNVHFCRCFQKQETGRVPQTGSVVSFGAALASVRRRRRYLFISQGGCGGTFRACHPKQHPV